MDFKNCIKEINDINDTLLNIDKMIWGILTPEECDDIFNNKCPDGKDYFDDWGPKSLALLCEIRDKKKIDF